ncbi:MAG TPA: ABC transporter permease [Bryobacteraceae bacterium]|nr:ABC transporter permease [Bryobacteraceae bacterium]
MFSRKRNSGDFRSEIDAHLQLEIDRLREQGLTAEEARTEALRAFGNRTLAEERFYEAGRAVWWDSLVQNIRFGVRTLARTPASTLIAIVTLALGIGANTAIFTLMNTVMLRSLPVREPQQLVLFGRGRWAGSNDDLPNRSWQLFSYRFFKEFRHRNEVFSDVAAIDSILFGAHARVGSSPELEKVSEELVSGSYFNTLGVSAILGRTFTDEDDRIPGGHPLAVASYSWWKKRFGGNPAVLGTKITIRSTVYTIIGVTPPEFFGTTVGQSPDVWIPLAMEAEISPGWNGLDRDLFQSLYVIARRRPGVSMERASANTNFLFRQIIRRYAGTQPSAKQLADISHARIDLTPAANGFSQLRRQFSSPLMILMGVVALVLLIACANVANLLLARAAARQREMAVRMSIGASRGRLLRQLLTESALLGVAGVVLGIAVAYAAGRLLLAMAFNPDKPLPIEIAPDAHVLFFTLGVAMSTVLLFGMAPAYRATRVQLVPALKETRSVVGGMQRNRLARGLVIGQVALSLLLLAGAGLFLRSLNSLLNVDTGFDRQNVLIVGVDPDGAGYQQDARVETMMQRAEERVSGLPGVQAAAFAFFVFNGGGWTDVVTVPGRPSAPHDPEADHNIVGPQYLSAMRMPILLGRGLEAQDDFAAPKVAVINETMARTYFAGGSPLGRTFSVGKDKQWQDIRVVGVVRDAKYMDLDEKQMPAAFYPHAQHAGFLYNFVVRYHGDLKAVAPRIRRAFADVDPHLPVGDMTTLSRVIDDAVVNQRMVAQLSTLFGALATFLACIGIYGVMSYGVARRTNELGVRMALGAARGDVLWMVLREVLGLLGIGVAAGLALAIAASRALESLLFGAKPFDPVVIGAATLIMAAVALSAGFLPARRATRIDPMIALRYE